MLNALLERQRQSIETFFQQIDLESTEKLLQLILECSGVVFFTGVGKSGFIAEKIAATMTSTGTKSLYISPMNALHGDIGMVSAGDLFVIISKSGESDELHQLLPVLHNRDVQIIGIFCNKNSRLAKHCHHTVILPVEKELCPYDLVPTTSTAAQMMFGDLLAIALMQAKNFSVDQFAFNHPAGRIGKRINMKVSNLMLTDSDLPTCSQNTPIVDTLVELSNKRCGCVLIVDETNKLQGIFTDGDLRRALQKEGTQSLLEPVHTVMTKTPKTITSEVPAIKALELMESYKQEVTVLPVIDDEERLLGLIKMHDIIQSGL